MVPAAHHIFYTLLLDHIANFVIIIVYSILRNFNFDHIAKKNKNKKITSICSGSSWRLVIYVSIEPGKTAVSSPRQTKEEKEKKPTMVKTRKYICPNTTIHKAIRLHTEML